MDGAESLNGGFPMYVVNTQTGVAVEGIPRRRGSSATTTLGVTTTGRKRAATPLPSGRDGRWGAGGRGVPRQGIWIALHEHLQEPCPVLLRDRAEATKPRGHLGIGLLRQMHRLQERVIGVPRRSHLPEQRGPTRGRHRRGARAGREDSALGEEGVT
jgi:hypothetical protein